MSRTTKEKQMDRPTRAAARAAAALVLAVGLAGCSDDDKPSSDEPEPNGIEKLKPAAAIKEASKAVRPLSDVTYAGTGGFSFETGLRRVKVRMLVTKKGNCELVVTSKATGRMTIRLVGGTAYLRGDLETWTVGFGAPEANARLLSGKWLSAPVSAESADDCSIEEYSAQSADEGTCTKGKAGEVDGTPTQAFRCKDDETGEPATMHISTVDEPLVLRVVGEDEEDGPYDLRLVDHDSDAVVKAPPRKDVIDSAQLG